MSKVATKTLLTIDVKLVSHIWIYDGFLGTVVESAEDAGEIAQQVYAISMGLA